jgi:MFS family permease
MAWSQTKTNIAVLSLCQAMTNTTNAVILTVSGLAGLMLAPASSFANMPLALQFLGTALTAAPASYFMQRFGRRAGFTQGAVIGVMGSLLGAFAIYKHIFWLFGLGGFLLGVFNGFALYYRFAAADTASEEYRSRAISLVLAGGVLAAIVGPELAKWSRNLLAEQFIGTYLSISLLPIICLIMLPLVRIPRVEKIEFKEKGRPITEVVRQPVVAVAILGGMVSYGVMAFLMTATPLAMNIHLHPFHDTAFVIQWHVVGMFAPSFFTGHLIKRYGLLRIMVAGILLNLCCVLTNLQGTAVGHFWLGLFFLGIGWNFLFVGSTTLLTEGYTPAEKTKTQAVNEFAVFSVMVVASMSSSTVLDLFGWRAINYGALPFLLVMLVAIIFLQKKRELQRPGD